LFLTLLRHEKPNAILIGEPGVGKTSIIHNAAYLIANKLCPSALEGFKILEVNTNNLLAGPGYRGVTEEKFQRMIDSAVSSGKVILFMDEFHTVEHLGEMANGQTPGLGNTLKPYLTRPNFRVVGCTTIADFNKMTDKALLRRFFKIEIQEPNDKAITQIITKCLQIYGRGIKFKKSIIADILSYSKTLDGFNPDKAKDITDFVCSYCKLKNHDTLDSAKLVKFFDQYFLMRVKDPELQQEAIIEE
jgi:ATP-dependent Clp protease ATP-binding subunit ClpA